MTNECLNLIIACAAFLISLITAIIQIKLQLSEMRPYLSFTGFRPVISPATNNGTAIEFILSFENAGKCVLNYYMEKFEVYINNLKQPDVAEHSRGGVVGVNAKASHLRYYDNIYIPNSLPDAAENRLPNCKIIFETTYHKIGGKKLYKINCECEFKDGRTFFNKSFAD